MIEAEVPDACVHHPVRREGKRSPDDGARKNVVPVVVLIDRQGARNEHGAQDGRVECCELPHVWRIVGEHLELGVEVEVKEDKARNWRDAKCVSLLAGCIYFLIFIFFIWGGGVGKRTGCGGVSGWEGFKRVVDFLAVAGADAAVVHYRTEASAVIGTPRWETGFTDLGMWFRKKKHYKGDTGEKNHRQEMRPQATNQPLQKHLKDGSIDERVE